MITQAPYTVTNPNQLPALTIVAMKENDGEGAFAVGPMIAHDYEDIFKNNYVQLNCLALPTQTIVVGLASYNSSYASWYKQQMASSNLELAICCLYQLAFKGRLFIRRGSGLSLPM